MRLFVGIAVPPLAIPPLSGDERLRWSPAAKLHITTKFIGEWPESRLDDVRHALRGVTAPALNIQLNGLEWLSDALCARVEANPTLVALAAATNGALVKIGVPAETRMYHPHVTLARVRKRFTLLSDTAFAFDFRATSFHLYLSASGQYTKLNEFPLVAEASPT